MRPQGGGSAVAPVVVLGLLLSCAGPAAALELDWSVGSGIELTDNASRSADGGEAEQIGVLWAGLEVQEDTPMLQMGLTSLLQYRDYQQQTFDDHTLFALSAQFTASLIPRRLHWRVEDYFRQIRVDDLSPLTPDNRQDINVFWTGPDLFFRFGPSTELQLGGRFGHHYYQEVAGDNIRLAGSAALTRRLTTRMDGSLNSEVLRVEYEDANLFNDFTRYDGFAGLDLAFRHSDLTLELGASHIERSGAADLQGALAALRLTRRLPRGNSAGVAYRQHYSESGATLLAAGDDPLLIDLVTTVVPRDIAYIRRAELYHVRARGGLYSRLLMHWRDEEFEVGDLDRIAFGGRLDLGYALTAMWSGGAYLSYRRSDYRRLERQDDDWLLGAHIEYRFTRHAVASLGYAHDTRNSSLPAADYRENVVLLGLRYGERPSTLPR